MHGEQPKGKEMDFWLHTTILRLPISCSGSFIPAGPIIGVPGSASATHPFRCTACGHDFYVTSLNLRLMSPADIFPAQHWLSIPEYTQDVPLLMRVLNHIRGQSQVDSLLYHLVRVLGVSDEDIPLSHEKIKILFQMQVSVHSSEIIAGEIWQAYQRMQEEDWKLHREYASVYEGVARRLLHMHDDRGIPLFARSGGPKDCPASYDLPYALVYPDRYFIRQARILCHRREFFEFGYPLEVAEFGNVLKKAFYEVSGPLEISAGHLYDYWGYVVNI